MFNQIEIKQVKDYHMKTSDKILLFYVPVTISGSDHVGALTILARVVCQ
jgi:hypothetical protein